jgi:hypothetical protein
MRTNRAPAVDPQADVDDHVRRQRSLDHRRALIARWLSYAMAERQMSRFDESRRDLFGRDLHIARAQVRDDAASVLRTARDCREAAEEMMDRARRLAVRELPLIGYDDAALAYTKARTWQACAWDIDPEMEQVQPQDCQLPQ